MLEFTSHVHRTVAPCTHRAATAKLHSVQGLRNYLGVFEGMRVMLLKNLWQQAGLVNGSMGEVKKVVWADGETKGCLPAFVVVDFKGYRGPPFKGWPKHWDPTVDRRTWVPIGPYQACCWADLRTAEITRDPLRCTPTSEPLQHVDDGKAGRTPDYDSVRTQIPITPTRALTFYKAQGLTLERVFVRINSIRNGKPYKYRHKFGLLYTGFSRVRDFLHLRMTYHSRSLRLPYRRVKYLSRGFVYRPFPIPV